MSTTVEAVLRRLADDGIDRIELKVADLRGRWHPLTLAADQLSATAFREGLRLSLPSDEGRCTDPPASITVWPDPDTAWIDPFLSPRGLSMIGSFQPEDGPAPGWHCSRSLAMRAMEHLEGSGLADTAWFGCRAEFFVFGQIQAQWDDEGGSSRILAAGVPLEPLHGDILLTLGALGLPVGGLHQERASPRHALELGVAELQGAADQLMITRHVVRQVAWRHGLAATFLPKPLAAATGCGMTVHQSLWKAGQPLFFGEGTYAGLSQTARWYLGGLLAHAHSLQAFTQPGTNSYRRLRADADAPVRLGYGRTAPDGVIGLPEGGGGHATQRLLFRGADGLANPYLAYAALLMAGLDGIRRQIDPGPPIEAAGPETAQADPAPGATLATRLDDALASLATDNAYLLAGGVFGETLIGDWISLRRQELDELRAQPHPLEFRADRNP